MNKEDNSQKQFDMQQLQDAYQAGWQTAAEWLNSNHLMADIGSPAYLKDMANALSPFVISQPKPR